MTHPPTDTKVMVVSNSIRTLKSIFDYLEKMSVQPLLAENGIDAINTYSREYPDIVILDDSIPDMEASAVAETIRAMERDKDWTAIIFLTSLHSDDDLVHLINSDDDFHLIKPISKFALKTIQHLLTMQSRLMNLTCSINYAKNMLNQITEPGKPMLKANLHKEMEITLHK